MRAVPRLEIRKVWRVGPRRYLREWSAYYAIAKDLVATKYPRWLDDADLEQECGSSGETLGDMHAAADQMPDWRLRRNKRHHLFYRWFPGSEYEESHDDFDMERWRAFVSRVAKHLRASDHRRAQS